MKQNHFSYVEALFSAKNEAVVRFASSPERETGNGKQETRRERRSAFTLIELLVVITIMAMLLALLGGGIRKSIENAKKRSAATEREAVRSAIMTFWHDTGNPPIELTKDDKGYSTFVFGEKLTANNLNDLKKKYNITKTMCKQKGDGKNMELTDVLGPLMYPDKFPKLNALHKTYLTEKDVNPRNFDTTADDEKKSFKRITIFLSLKDATVE